MFGTDNGMDEEMYRNQFRWLETADESFDYWGYPGQGRWEIYGLELARSGAGENLSPERGADVSASSRVESREPRNDNDNDDDRERWRDR